MADGVLVVRIPKGNTADGPRTVPVEAPFDAPAETPVETPIDGTL
jgi:hypothetical protein